MFAKLDSKGMKNVRTVITEQESRLKRLTKTPFHVENEAQLAEIKKYIDDFDVIKNQTLLIQGLSTGLIAWISSLGIRYFLPVPDFVKAITDAAFYLGGGSAILYTFAYKDFFLHLEEMQTIYNWALKNGAEDYDGKTDNTDKLNNPLIQRLIKTIAPFSEVEFMIAWPKVTEQNEQSPSMFAIAGGLYKFFLSSNTKASNGLKELQTQVETDGFKIGALQGLKMATEYFATDLDFRARAIGKLHEPLDYIKNILPDVTQQIVHAKMP